MTSFAPRTKQYLTDIRTSFDRLIAAWTELLIEEAAEHWLPEFYVPVGENTRGGSGDDPVPWEKTEAGWDGKGNGEMIDNRIKHLKGLADEVYLFIKKIESSVTCDFSSIHLKMTGNQIPIPSFDLCTFREISTNSPANVTGGNSSKIANQLLDDANELKQIQNYCQAMLNFEN